MNQLTHILIALSVQAHDVYHLTNDVLNALVRTFYRGMWG